MRLEVSQQVMLFVSSLAPEPRKALRRALRNLAQEKGDIKALHGELDGFYRLKVGHFRVVFWYGEGDSERTIRCEYAESRGMVYELFEQIASRLRE